MIKHLRARKQPCGLAMTMLLLLWQIVQPLHGATMFWSGTTDATWATTTNWSPNTVPVSGDTATFNSAGNGNTTINLGAGVTVNTILFDTASAAAYTIGSGAVHSQTLTLDNLGAITMNSTVVANQLFNAAIVLGTDATAQSYTITNSSTTNSLTFAGNITGGTGGTAGAKALTISAAAGNVIINGIISNGGATSLPITKTGAGTLELNGNNIYTGITTISAGTVKLGNATALGSSAAATDHTTVAAGATLDLNGLTIAEAFGRGGSTLPLDGFGGATAILTNSSSTAAAITGTINFDGGGAFTVNGTGNISLARVARTNGTSGDGMITKEGTNTLILDGTADNVSLQVTVNNGIVQLNKGSTGVRALGGATTTIGASGTLRLTTGQANGDQIFANVNVVNNGIFDLQGQDESFNNMTGTGSVTNGATNNASVLTLGENNGGFTWGGVIQDGAGTSTLALTKMGTGVMTITGTNTYTGATRIDGFGGGITLDFATAAGAINLISSSSALTMNNTSAVRTQTLTLTGKASTINSQTFNGTAITGTGTRHQVVATSGTSGTMNLSLGALTLSNSPFVDFVLPTSGSITTSSANAVLGPRVTINNGASYAQISGGSIAAYNGSLVYATGTDISALAGYDAADDLLVDNTSTGNVIQAAGTTQINTIQFTDSATRVLTLGVGTTLQLGSTGGILRGSTAGSVTIGDVVNSGTLTTGTAAGDDLILTNGNATGTLTVNSVIANNAGGAVDVFINGNSAATTILAGANTMTGAITVQSGSLRAANSAALGTVAGGITVFDGAALELSGGITVGDEALSITGGTGIGSNGALRNQAGANTYGGLVTLLGTAEIQVDTGTTLVFDRANQVGTSVTTASGITLDVAGTLTFNDALVTTGTANPTITKSGTGVLNLNAANTWAGTGAFSISAGIVRISNGAALGGTSAGTTIVGNATAANRGSLELIGGISTNEAITINSSAAVNANGAIRNISGNNTITGQVTIDNGLGRIHSDSGTLTLAGGLRADPDTDSTRTVTFGGLGNIVVSGVAANVSAARILAITKEGTGTLTLSAANTYTGVTTVSGGTLIATSASALGTGNVVVATNTAFNYFAAADAALSIGGTLGITGGTNTVIGGSIGSTTTSAQINVTGAATISNAAHRVNIYGVPGTTPTTGTYTLIQGGASSSLNPTTAPTLGSVFNNTNFTVGAFTRSSTQLQVDITAATPITAAFWKGGLTGATNVWAASNGTTQSNFVTSLGGANQALVPGAGADVTFSDTTPTTAPTATVLGGNMTIRTLTIADTANGLGLNADGYTLTIANAGGITMNASVPASTIAANVALGASQTWTNNSANGLTVSGVVSGAFGLTKAGAGTLTLGGFNTYTGGTILSEGRLIAASTQALGLAANTLNLAGGTLELAINNSIAANVTTVSGNATIVSNRATADAGITHTLGTLSIGANTLTVNAGSNVTGGTAGVTFGATTFTGAPTFDLGTGANLTLGAITNASNFATIKQGAGTLTIGGANASTGTLAINAGTVTINGSGQWAGNITVASGATLQNTGGGTNSLVGTITVQSGGVFDNQQTGAETIAVFNLEGTGIGGSGAWVNNAAGTTAGALTSTAGITLTGNASVGGSGNLNTSSIINGASFGLTKVGNGTLTLGGVNTFGSLNILAGTVAGTTSNSAFGAGTITLGDSVANAANVTLTGFIPSANIANPIVLASGTTGVITIATTNNTTPFAYSGGVTGTNNVRIAANAGQSLTFSTSPFNNTGSITNVGTGTGGAFISANIGSNVTGITQSSATSALTLSGSAIASNGPLAVSAGTLNITGGTTTAPTLTALSVAGGGTLNLLNGAGQQFDLGAGVINLGAGTGTATLGLELGALAGNLFDSFKSTGTAVTANNVVLNLTGVTGFGAGTYDLITAGSGLSGATYSIGSLSGALGGFSLGFTSSGTSVRLTSTAYAGDYYWNGGLNTSWAGISGVNTNFTTNLAGTSNANGVPGVNNSVIFSSSTQTGTTLTTTLDGAFSIKDLTFNNQAGSGPLGTININPGTGGSLTLTDGINVQTGAPAAINLSALIVLGAHQTWTVADALTVLSSSGGISGSGINLTKAGVGRLGLLGTNTYSGITTVNAGILAGAATNALSPNSAHVIGANGTLALNGFAQTIGSLAGSAGAIVANGAASGNVALTAGGDNTSTTFAGNLANGSTATLALTKVGTGMLTLSGNNSNTGNFTTNGGRLALTGGTTSMTAGQFTTGSAATTRGMLLIGSGAIITTTDMDFGSNATGAGAGYQTGGSVTLTAADATGLFGLGNAAGGYGYYRMSGGTVTTNRITLVTTPAAGATGIFHQTGGTVTVNTWTTLGHGAGNALLDIEGGTYNSGTNFALGVNDAGAYSVFNVRGTGTFIAAGTILTNRGDNAARDNMINILNFMTGGTVRTASGGITNGTTNGAINNLVLINLNGGTIITNAGSTSLININNTNTTLTGNSGVFVYGGGVNINTNGFNSTIPAALQAPTGVGVSSIAVSSSGSGYIGAPFVKITGGSGVGATAVANMVDDGTGNGTFKIDSITITNPGTGYLDTDTPTVTFGDNTSTYTTQATLGTVTMGSSALVSGGLTKTGAGTLTLTVANTYAGATTINQGTLVLGPNATLSATSGLTLASVTSFTLDNSATNLANRVADTASFTAGGGTFNFIGNASATSQETFGTLNLNAGALTINSTNGGGGNVLTFSSMGTRAVGGTLYVNGTGLGGGSNQVVFTTAPALTSGILKYAVVNNGTLASFATHGGDGTSLIPLALASHNQAAETTWVVGDNARPTADVTVGAARSLHTLTLDSGIDLLAPTADRILTMTGGVLQTGGTSIVGATSTLENILAFGANEALFHVLGTLQIDRGNITASASAGQITGTGGFTKSGIGTLILNSDSAMSGAININEGILELRRTSSLMFTAATASLNGATLRLSNDANTTFTGNWVVTADSTIEVSRVTAAATATTHTVGTLNMGSGRTLTVNPNATQISGGATAYGLTTGALTLNGPATFNVANNGTGTGTLTVGTITGAFAITKTGSGNLVTSSTASGYTAPVSILAGNVGWSNGSGTITENQLFSGAGGIIKSGAGTVNLTSANTFLGGVTTTGGVLQFTTVGNNGSTSATNLGQGTDGLTLSGGTLSFIGSTSQSTNRGGTVNASTSLAANGTGGATITYSGAFTAPGTDVTLTLTGSGNGFILGNLVGSSGTGDTTKDGSGTWTWTGAGSTGDDLLVNAGRLILNGSQKTVTDDVVVTGATAILDLDATGVINGSGTTSGLFARTGATINLNADNAYNTSNGLDLIVLGDTTTGGATLNTNTFNITTPRLDVGQDSTGFVGSITGSGTVTVGTSAHLFQGSLASTASLLGAGSVYKLGGGTFTLSGVMSGMTSATGPEIHSGVLALDYTTNNAAKFAATASLNMSGGTLQLNGNASADTLQSLAGLSLSKGTTTGNFPTLTGGSSIITLTPGGSQKIALSIGGISRSVGGSTIRFNLPAGTQSATNGILTTQANTNGIIGGYATVFDGTSTNFATNSGGNIVAITPTAQDDVTLWTTAQNISDSSGFSGTLSANTNITSLRFNAAAASTVTIASGVILNLSSGGVLQTGNVGGVSTIASGRLQSGAGSELIFNVDSATQRLEVTSQITGSASVTKSGIGTLRLNSANNFYSGTTSVLGGILEVSGGNAIGDRSDLIVGGGQTSTFRLLADEVIGNLTLGGENGSTAGVGVVSSINVGSSKLTFNQETAITMAGVLFSSDLNAGALVKSGSATWTNAAANPGFSGTFQVDRGLVVFNGNFNNLSAATAIVLNGPGSSLRLDADQTTANNRIGNGATITLNNTAGITADALGFYQRRNGGSNTGNEVVGRLILGAGHNTVAADGNGTGRIGTITFTDATSSLQRNNLATLFVVGRGLGDTAVTIRGNVAFSLDPGGSIGGAGGADTSTIKIYPYVIGENTAGAPSGAVNFGNSFVRFVSTAVGFKPLKLDTEYVNDQTAYDALGAGVLTNNVRFSTTTTTLASDTTGINSLVLDHASGITVTGPSQSLELTSGVLLSAGSGANIIEGFTGITTGPNPYYVYVTNPSGSLTLNSALTTGQALVKSGAGALILGSSGNLFTDLHFNQGVVQADAQNKLGTGALNFFGGTLQFTSAFDASFQADLATTKTITLGTGGGTFDTGSFAITLANAVGNGGAGGLTKVGTGSLTLSAPASYLGATWIQNGTIILASGGNNRLPATTALTLGAGVTAGVLQLGNGTGASNQTVSEISNSGSVGAGNKIIGGDSALSVLTVNQATQTNFSGSIGGLGTNENNVGITKSGVGSLTLSGATLTFAGPLAVTAGDLNITGSTGAALTPSALTVNAGATLNLLNGVGQTINLVAGALNLGAGSGPAILGLELGSTSAYDQIVTTGSATTSGSVLINLTNLAGFGAGNYDLLKADTGGLSGATYTLGAAALGGVSLNLVPTDTLVQLQVSAIVGDLYWKGAVGAGWNAFNGANSNFTTGLDGNTNAFGIPGTNNGVIFSANSQTNTALNTTLNANFFIRDLTFNNNLGSGPLSSISIAEGSGGSLTITPTDTAKGINMQAGSVANVTISAPVVLGASQTWTVADSGSLLTVSGGVTGTGDFVKAGAGSLALGGSVAYTGTTTVSAGRLIANSASAFNSTSAFSVGATGTLRMNGFSQTVLSLTGAAGSILENGAASGNVILTVGDSTSTVFAGNVQNGGAATLGLTKVGTGQLTLSGNNTYTGNTVINAGILQITGSITTVGGDISVGNAAGNRARLQVGPSTGAVSTDNVSLGANATAAGAIFQSAGTFASTQADGTNQGIVLGATAGGGYGSFNLSTGTLTANRITWAANGQAGATGVFTQTGGTATVNTWTVLGHGTSGNVLMDISGGTFNAGTNIAAAHGSSMYVVTNVRGTGVLNRVGGTSAAFGVLNNNANNSNNISILNIGAGGTFNTNSGGIGLANPSGTATNNLGQINFNGGTLFTNAASATLVAVTATGLNAGSGAFIHSGGLTVNTNNFNSTISASLQAPTGRGVSTIAVATQGSGYLSAPMIKITGGSGVGATAVANMVDDGTGNGTFKIDTITITNPGTGYVDTDVLTLAFADNTSLYTTQATFGAVAFNAGNTSGGLIKTGAGTLTLSGANTYTGGSNINAGTLALGAINVLADAGAVTINGGTFDVATFNDTVGVVTLQSGTLQGSTGVLTSTSNFILQSGTVNFTGSGGLGGAVNVSKTTAGTVTLTNNGLGSFANLVNVSGGTLSFSTSGHLGDASTTNDIALGGGTLQYTGAVTTNLTTNRQISLTNGTTSTIEVSSSTGILQVTSAANGLTASGGAANLTKTGIGLLEVTSPINLSGGTLTVSAGTVRGGLVDSGTNTFGAINVAGGATLNLYDGAAVTSAITGLTLANGASLGFDLGASGVNDVLNLNSAPSITATVLLNFNNLGTMPTSATGIYDLITTTTDTFNAANFSLGLAPSGFNYNFTTTNSDKTLRLTTTPLVLRYWTGDQDGNWNTDNGPGNTNWASDAGGTELGVLPAATDTLVFSATTAVGPTLATSLNNVGVTADSLRFVNAPTTPVTTSVTIESGGGAGILTLNPISANNGISVAALAGDVTISAALVAAANQTWEVEGTSPSSLTVSGNVTFTGSVTKTGAGTLTLSGTNSGAGGLNLVGGTAVLNSNSAVGDGAFTVNAGTTLNSTVAGVTLTAGSHLWNGIFTFTGSQDLNLGTGAVTLANNVTATTTAGNLTVGGVIGQTGGSRLLTKAGAGTLTLSGSNTWTGGLILSGGTLNINNSGSAGTSSAIGTGILTIAGGTTIDNTSGGAVTLSTNNVQAWNGSFTFTGSNALNLGTGAVTLGSSLTATIGGTGTTGVLTVGGGISGAGFGLTKAGTGTLVLSGLSSTAASNFSGNLTLDGGTTNITSTASLTGGLVFGAANASTTNSTLNLAASSLTVGGATVVQTNSTTANVINIGDLQTLRLNGAVTVGASTGPTTTVLNVAGAGTLTIGAAGEATNANVQVGNSATSNQSNSATWDMSALGTFYANLGSGTFRVGDPTNSGGTATAGSTLILAANSTIIANSITSDSPAGDSANTLIQRIRLGSGTNILNANTITIGASGNRANGILDFFSSTGTVQIRDLAGTGRANMNVANGAATTGFNFISSVDFAGHNADLLLGTVAIGGRSAAAAATGTGSFAYDAGTVDATTFNVGFRTGTTSTSGSVTGTLSIGGGTSTIGTITLATNSVTGTTSTTGSATGNLTISGGTNTINTLTMATNSQGPTAGSVSGDATANVTISGGTNSINALTMGVNTVAAGFASGSDTITTLTISGGATTVNTAFTMGAQNSAFNSATTVNTATSTLNISAGSLTLAGSTNLTMGQTTLDGNNAASASINITGGMLTVGGNIQYTDGLGTESNIVTLNGGTLDMTGGNIGGAGGPGAGAGIVTFNAQSGTLQNVAQINGGAGLTKTAGTGTNTLILEGTNSYTGGTTISAGTLQIGNGSTTGTIGAGNIANSGTLAINRGNDYTLSNNISGTGALNQIGSGTTVLSGTNTYTGKTTISAGKLSIDSEARLGGNPGSPTADQLTLAGGTLLTTATFAIDDANRGITVGTGGGTFETSASTTLTVNSAITGSGTITKEGTGALILNAVNTSTGATTVNAGTLQVGVSGAGSTHASSTVTLNGSSAVLAGSGTVNGSVVVTAGQINPGDSAGAAIGTLTVGGDVTLTGAGTPASRLTLQLAATSASSINDAAGIQAAQAGGTLTAYLTSKASDYELESGTHDKLTLSGALRLNAGGRIALDNTLGYSFAFGDVFDMIDWGSINLDFDGVGGFGSFDSASDLLLPSLGSGLAFDTSLFSTNGIVVVVPEPSRALFLMFGLLGLMLRRRRR